MGTTEKDELADRLVETRPMFCQRCFKGEPAHAVWFKVQPNKPGKYVVGQIVCDQCLDSAITALAAARAVRVQLGSPCWMVEVKSLID